MSLNYSNGSLYLRVTNLLQALACRNRETEVTATGVAEHLHEPAKSVAPMLVRAVEQNLLIPRVVDRCEECGRETEGLLDQDEWEGKATCLNCGDTFHRKYVVYSFAPSLVQVAGEKCDPKAMRRRAPLR